MPLTCIILNCGSRANRDPVKFYAVPKVLNFAHLKHKNELSKLRREMWLSAIKRNDLTDNKIKHQRVCSKHFLSGKPATLEDKDDLDWIPSQNLGHTSTDFRKKPETSDRSPTNFDEPSSNVLKLDMPGCAAINCSNSNAKGFLMKKFPTDPVRRKEWVDRMKRDKWMPTKHSCICEVHFEQQMWEKTRVDGRRTLKCSAVPTLFCFSKPKPARKPRTKRVSTTSRILKNGENLTTPMDFEQVIVEGLPRVGELSKTGFSTIPDIDYIKKEHDYTKNENLTASMDFEQIIVEGLPRIGARPLYKRAFSAIISFNEVATET
ncbi:hypothetical protein RN001_013649 [Aquatica leii]|uniref:THAP-type domain-containing protein n=1 Tax=Aquatica leii TaxID=1421715 RepID=A0AAN7SE13_9COLE|nr:hypothetical protein RN001_013649 [Aquatica leii]